MLESGASTVFRSRGGSLRAGNPGSLLISLKNFSKSSHEAGVTVGERTDRRSSSRSASDVASGAQTRSGETGHVYQFGPYRLDPGERTLLHGNEAVTLPPKAFDTLVLMVRNSGRLMEKDELIRTLWPDSFVSFRQRCMTLAARDC